MRRLLLLLLAACSPPTSPEQAAPPCVYVPTTWTHVATGKVHIDSTLVCEVPRV